MKVLVINGSPKAEKSNSFKLTEAFLEGINEKIEIETSVFHLAKLNLKPCLGCFNCWKKTPGKCIINDDGNKILEKMIESDIIIHCFGLYYYSVPSILKNFIDRNLPLALPFMDSNAAFGGHKSRFDFSTKRFVIISTCGFYTSKNNYNNVFDLYNHIFGKDNYENILCGQGELFSVVQLKERTSEYLKNVKIAGNEFSKGKISNLTKNLLQEPLYPREAFEKMADSSWGLAKDGIKKESISFGFTKQMASLYNKKSYPGKDIIIEFNYTDIKEKYQIVLTANESIVLKENFKKPTTIITTPFETWTKISKGEITGPDALYRRLYSVDGDFKTMLNWNKYFGKEEKQKYKHIPNMLILLIPWISFWVAVSINSFYGGLAVLIINSLIGIFYLKYKPVFWESISLIITSTLSCLSIFLDSLLILIPISYLLFGLMWLISTTLKIPLSAHYSSLGDKDSLSNKLFIRTNRILTFLWGVLYIITPIWTYFILKSNLKNYTGLINSLLPLIMGGFTYWFKDWYPGFFSRTRKK